MNQIEKSSQISPYPPTRLIPWGLYETVYNMVIHGRVIFHKRNEFAYLAVELSAPSIYYMDDSLFLGLLAHEFLHYVILTIEFKNKLNELESKGDSHSPLIIGEIPNKDKMSQKERDRYFFGNPKEWFNDETVIKSVEELESIEGTTMGKELSENVMNWMKRKRRIITFKRGEIEGAKATLWLYDDIIKKGKELGLTK